MCGTEQSKEFIEYKKDKKFAKFSRETKFDTEQFLEFTNTPRKDDQRIFQKRDFQGFDTSLGKILLNKLEVFVFN